MIFNAENVSLLNYFFLKYNKECENACGDSK